MTSDRMIKGRTQKCSETQVKITTLYGHCKDRPTQTRGTDPRPTPGLRVHPQERRAPREKRRVLCVHRHVWERLEGQPHTWSHVASISLRRKGSGRTHTQTVSSGISLRLGLGAIFFPFLILFYLLNVWHCVQESLTN